MLNNHMTIDIDKWDTPATHYPRRKIGDAEIVTARYTKGVYDAYLAQGVEYYIATKRLNITALKIDGKVWMVDDPPHWWAMRDHADALSGHVICAGLGLGLMVHTMTARPEIHKITVVEESQDVIDLVGPLVPHDKLEIIHDDWFDVDPVNIDHVDSVLFDLFVSDNGIECLVPAFGIAREAIMRFGENITVRVHGMPNPLIENVARAEIELLAKNQ